MVMEEKKEKSSSYRKGQKAERVRKEIDGEYKPKADFNAMLRKNGYKEYDERIIPHIIDMFKSGLSKVAVCNQLGISIQTMKNWRRRYDNFNDVCEIGETALEDYWDNIGMQNLLNKELNTQVYLFFASKFKVREAEEEGDDKMKMLKKMSEDFDALKKEYEKEY